METGLQTTGKSGKPLVAIRPTEIPEEQFLISDFEIFRDDLATILFGLTKDNPRIKYVFGEQIRALRQKGNKVFVEILNGQLPPSQYDLVVAADGATSRTRALGFECNVKDYTRTWNAWAAYCTIEKNILGHANMCE